MSVTAYDNHLKGVGIADTRALPLAMALDNLHRAIAQLDETNLALLALTNPEAIDAANAFAKQSDCLREF